MNKPKKRMKNKKYKLTFEVELNFKNLIDEETFKNDFKSDLFKLCKYMCKHEGIMGWYDKELKLVKAEFVEKNSS